MSSEPHDVCESMRLALLQRAESASASRAADSKPGAIGETSSPSSIDEVSHPVRPLDAAPSSGGGLDTHLADCAACRRELARATHRTLLVRTLPRFAPPVDLDGVVVAALQAGMRQKRAIQAITSLTPVAAPDVLAQRIAGVTAPAVLERLVSEDLADPAKAVASRYTRRLERLRAPTDLEHRLGHPPRRSRSRFLPLALVTAGLLLTVGTLALAHFLRGTTRGVPTLQSGPVLVVEHVDSVQQLDPIAGMLLAGFTGGLVDVERLKREEL